MRKITGIKAIFFDLDGTLIDVSKRELYAIKDTVEHFGVEASLADIRKLMDTVSKQYYKLRTDLWPNIFKLLGLTFDDETYKQLVNSFLKRYKLTSLPKGTKESLSFLSRKYKILCVTSRETLFEVKRELDFLKIERFFDQIVTREVAANHFQIKALPFVPFNEHRKKLYDCALDIVRFNPLRFLVIGDMAKELEPAKQMEMITIGLLSDREKDEKLRNVSDYLISKIQDLKQIL